MEETMKLKIYTSDGSESRDQDFTIAKFEGNKGLEALRQVLLAYQANQRQGNACTRTRDEVSGTGKKPYRQKGTGSARHGSRRSPLFRGGGVVFGPRPRDYSQKINKKVRQLAFKRILFDRASGGDIDVIERFEISEPKTRLFNTVLNRIAPKGKVLIVDDTFNHNTILAARNISRLEMNGADNINALDLSFYDKIIISEKGLQKVLARAAEKPNP